MMGMEEIEEALDGLGEWKSGSLRNLAAVTICEVSRMFEVPIEEAVKMFIAFDRNVASGGSMGENFYFHSPNENPLVVWYFALYGEMKGYGQSKERMMTSDVKVTEAMRRLKLWVD